MNRFQKQIDDWYFWWFDESVRWFLIWYYWPNFVIGKLDDQ